ncbi:MAG: right-handed parallel beta-helix repeat-containing protein, partial [Armatimonadota bacterium]|nr:right-handed parallel beta-helix repeat-containing protein [Armatimonadota bacterium]
PMTVFKSTALALTLLLLMTTPNFAQDARPGLDRYFVAVDGNDAWSGKLPAPNKQKTDGPFASLERARDQVRERKTWVPFSGATIFVRGGTYFLKAPFVLTPEDSGTAAAPVVYTAYPGEKPVISGGQRITGWKIVGNRWETTVPDVLNGGWNFAQLFVNGERRSRPRVPEDGYVFIAGEIAPPPDAKDQRHDRFRFRPGDIRSDWSNFADVELLVFHTWSMSRYNPAAVDEKENIVTVKGHSPSKDWWGTFKKGNRYLVENVREALNKPGEWYLDRKTGLLTYIPLPGEDMSKAVVIAPRLDRLVEMKGDVAKRQWVQHITLRGLTFAHTNWTVPPQGHNFYQAEANQGAAISAVGARNCALEQCAVVQSGNYAIELGAGCKNNRIENCELTDLAAGGVKIGEMKLNEDDEAVASHNVINNCLIAHGGRMHPAAVGVWIGHSPDNKVLHNDIYDFYYTGISPGWSWGYGKSLSHHNEVAYNHIYQIGQGVLSDMGGIYTLGTGPNNHLHHNLIHDVDSFSYGGWGIYFDEGTSDIIAENNIVYRTKSAGFHQHYGKNNLVRNNIFAFGREAQLMRTRPEEHLSFTLERNIVYWADAPLLGSNWSGDTSKYKLDYNLYWRTDSQPVRFPGNLTFEQWQQKGQDVHSLIADPLFVNPQKDDFRLKPESPAFKLGFQPIDLSNAGRSGKTGAARTMPRAFPPPPPPPPPQPIVDDFETTTVGQKAQDATTFEENDQATVRVTEEVAASGKRSLKFVDVPGQKFNYNPHLYYSPKFTAGVILGRFDLRLEPGAVFYHEWRDNASPYQVGPSIRINADGTLFASKQKLAQLPRSQWINIEIVCGLGEQAQGKYHLTVRPLGGAPQVFPDLPCSRDFKALHWFGFVSDGTDQAVFYIDNVELKPEDK